MTSKERAALRKHANAMETIFQIGKDGIDDASVKAVGDALKARELIKCRVQDACPYTAREAAQMLAEKLEAEPVQVIGSRFVLYKRNKKINQYGI